MSKYGVISGPDFPVFGLNTEIYEVNLRIQSEYRKTRTRNNSVFGHISGSAKLLDVRIKSILAFKICKLFSLENFKLPNRSVLAIVA